MEDSIKRVKGKFAKGHKGWWSTHKMPPRSNESKKRYSDSKKKESNPQWKGDKVKYQGLHKWLRLNYGTPKKCDICGTEEDRMYHWANKSKLYLRDINDWLRLCVPCHAKFDGKTGRKNKSVE
jgi:hypothetical protein